MSDEVNGLGPVEIEWIINRQQIASDLEATEQLYDETVSSIEGKAAQAGDAIAKLIAKGGFSDSKADVEAYAASFGDISKYAATAGISLEELQARLVAVQKAQSEFAALDPQVVGIEEYNAGIAALADSEARLQAAINAETAVQSTQTNATKQGNAVIVEQLGLLEVLEGELLRLKELKPTLLDPKKLAETNALIQETEINIARLENVGKKGFDSLGNAAAKSKNYFSLAWSGIRQLAIALPGISAAGILAFATGPIIDYVSALLKGKDELNEFVQRMKAVNEVNHNANKDAATQIATLKLLYSAATDVTRAMDARLDAAQKLRETYPEEFANATNLAIINGEVKSSYDDLTASVMVYAKSKAALAKITDLEAKNLDAQFQIDKNNYAKANQVAKAYAQYQVQLKHQSPESAAATARGDMTYKVPGGFFSTPLGQFKEVVRQINEQTNIANLPFAQLLQTNNKVEGFLTGYVKTVDKGAEDLEKANKLLGTKLENLNGLLNNAGSFADLENIKSALETKLKALAPNDAQIANYQQQIRKVEELEKKFQPKLTDGNADAQSLKGKMALLRELAAANETFNRKQLTDDQAALTAISDKFDQLRQKIAAFNANPKNKNNQIGQGDISKLDPEEFAALGGQADLNETKYIAQDLQTKKQLYAEYEAFREKVGKQAADAEYADLLKSGETFEVYIQTLQKSLTDVQNDISPAAFEDRKKLYEKYAQDIQKINSSFYLGMLADTLSFEQQTNAIIDNAIEKATALMKDGRQEQADLILAQADDELQLRVDSQKQVVQQYKTFYDQVAGLTKEEAINQIKFAQDRADADLHTRTIDEDTYNSLVKYIKQANDAINSNTILNGLNAVADALANISKSAEDLDKGFSSALSTIAQTIAQVAALGKQIEAAKNSLENFSKNKADAGGGFMGSVSALISSIPVVGGLISGTIGVVTSVVKGAINLFKSAKETAKQSAEELQRYQESLITGQIQYNELLREQAAAIKDINALNVQQLEQRKQLLATQSSEAQSDYNRLLQLIQGNGQQVTGEHTEKYGGFLGIAKKTRVVQDLAGLGGADYDTLLKLYTEGKLTDETKKWFEQLKNVHDEMGDIGDATQQVNDQIDEIFTGTTADSLEQAILTGLKNGKRGFADFSGDFSASLQDSIASIFEDTYLKDKAKAYYKEFASFSESGGGLDNSEISQLQKDYATLIDGASKTYDQLSKVGGQQAPTSTGESSGGITGAIKGITETQANALAGINRGIQLAVNQIADSQPVSSKTMSDQLDEMRTQTLLQMKIEVNTRRTADNTSRIADLNDKMSDSLGTIERNTSTNGLTNTLRAAGII